MTSTTSLPSGKAPTILRHNPPFRHEHVGSFLRTDAVHKARADFARGELDAGSLRKIEDEEIKKHIERCQHWKIRDLTDAEFRRQYFHVDFLQHLEGVEIQKNCESVWAIYFGSTLMRLQLSSKRRAMSHLHLLSRPSFATQRTLKSEISSISSQLFVSRADVLFLYVYIVWLTLSLSSATDQHSAIKITIPSPTMLHFRGGRKAISEEAYPNLDDFFSDLAACYRQEVDALYKAGCRYLQLDDTK